MLPGYRIAALINQCLPLEEMRPGKGFCLGGLHLCLQNIPKPHKLRWHDYEMCASLFFSWQELEDFKPYPVEIVPTKLYMGNYEQACNKQIQKDLKIRAQINISEEVGTL